MHGGGAVSAVDIAAVVAAEAAAAKAGARAALMHTPIDPAAKALVGILIDGAIDGLINALRIRHATVRVPSLAVTLRDHDDDPGAAPDRRPE